MFKLARTTGSAFKNYNLCDYKKYEEEGLQKLLHSFIESTIYEGEAHKEFAVRLKSDCVYSMENCHVECKEHKDEWISSIESCFNTSKNMSAKLK